MYVLMDKKSNIGPFVEIGWISILRATLISSAIFSRVRVRVGRQMVGTTQALVN